MDPNVSDPNERPLGYEIQTSRPYLERQVVDCVVHATMDPGTDKHAGLYSTSYSRSTNDPIIILHMYSLQQINVSFQLFIT
jgi:hypothetical protein